MSRLTDAWRAMEPEQRLASVASVALLVTMFFPWYGLQSLNRKTGAISSHTINAFGDVSFVEAAVFLVAAAVIVMLIARVEGRSFRLPGGDGTIVVVAGGWAALLIFYRVFSRPAGNGYPVGIEWGFFLAFVAAGALTYAGWRMRAVERPEPPARAPRQEPRAPSRGEQGPSQEGRRPEGQGPQAASPRYEGPGDQARSAPTDPTALVPSRPRPAPSDAATAAGERRGAAARPRYPPAPPGATPPAGEAEQLSFEDSPRRSE
jgi:hypothetical protein